MAITKNDMFDFLIDIVPREEIQLRSKTQKVAVRITQLPESPHLHSVITNVAPRVLREEEERVSSFYPLSCFNCASSSWHSKLCPQVQRVV